MALASETARQFRARHGRGAQWLASAPGRVNLIGEHVDYNDGLVLPMAIDRHLVVAAARADHLRDSGFRISSSRYDDAVHWQEGEPVPETGHWGAYVIGVLALCRATGMELPPLDLHVHGDLPAGAGLSSSAALEVATITLAEAASGSALTAGDRIEICREADHQWNDGLRFCLLHFKGRLDVGGVSVIAGVSAPHREEAFQACRYLVEQMKHRAPIWKMEHYVDGDTDWVKGHALCAHG